MELKERDDFDNLEHKILENLSEKYEISGNIDDISLGFFKRGGSSIVGTIYNKELGRFEVIKAGLEKLSIFEIERFKSEARLIADLTSRSSHPGIQMIFDYGDINGTPYMLMPYEKGDLSNFILKNYSENKKIEEDIVLDMITQINSALHFAHEKNIIHRDIKSSNILINEQNMNIKITDFGIAAIKGSRQSTAGTYAYMAPEQLEGKFDIRSDIYGVGCIFYEMITGPRITPNKQYHSETESEIRNRLLEKNEIEFKSDVQVGLSKDLEDLIRKFLYIDPDKRFQNASEANEAIKKYRNDKLKKEKNKITRRRFLIGSFISAVAAAVGTPAYLKYEHYSGLEILREKIKEIPDNDLDGLDAIFSELRERLYDIKIRKIVNDSEDLFDEAPRTIDDKDSWNFINCNSRANPTSGVWTELLFDSGDPQLTDRAIQTTNEIKLANDDATFSHTHRFLGSHGRAYEHYKERYDSLKDASYFEKAEIEKQKTLEAADVVLSKYIEKFGFFQITATGVNEEGKLNMHMSTTEFILPLLYFAYDVTGDEKYIAPAVEQLKKIQKYNIRSDQSIRREAIFNGLTGEFVDEINSKGFASNTTLSRAQTQAIIGFWEGYYYTKNQQFLETSVNLINYFLDNCDDENGMPKI